MSSVHAWQLCVALWTFNYLVVRNPRAYQRVLAAIGCVVAIAALILE